MTQNDRLLTRGAASAAVSKGLYRTDNDAVVLETVKPSLNGKGVVARYYNASETAQTAAVDLAGYRVRAVVNIGEETLSEKSDNALQLHPFELINLYYEKA